MKNQNRFLIPALLWLIVCTILFTLPASAFPTKRWYTKIPLFDKWVHIGLLSILTFFFCWGIFKRETLVGVRKKKFILTAIICIGYGIAIEFIQRYFIPNRSFDLGDILADAIGSFMGLAYSFMRYIKK